MLLKEKILMGIGLLGALLIMFFGMPWFFEAVRWNADIAAEYFGTKPNYY